MINHEVEPNSGSSREMGYIPISSLKFFALVGQLSEIKRQGWLDRGIEHPESVAEHSYLTAVMTAFEAERKGLDIQRAVKMALIHDLPEICTGDITPHQHLPESQRAEAILYKWIPPSEEALEAKREKEEKALQKIVRGLHVELRASIVGLWREYNEGQTEEAKLVDQMDHMQRLLQAKKYGNQEGESFPIESFIQEALDSGDRELKRLARRIRKDVAQYPHK